MSVKRVPSAFPSLSQPAKGYRYGIDSFLLARFAKFAEGEVVCDLGAGVGILGLLALQRGKAKQVLAVEIQEELAWLSLENAKILKVSEKFEILHGDWREAKKNLKAKRFNVVVSNPPYRKAATGKVPPESSKAIAKHEIKGTMQDLLDAARHLLKPSGRLVLMYPTLRLEELIIELQGRGFKIQRMAMVHPYADRPATLAMIEAVRSPVREIRIEAPVVIYRDSEHYQPEIESWVGPKRRV